MMMTNQTMFAQCSFPFDPAQSRGMLALLDKLETIDEWLETKEKQIKS